MLLLLLLVIFIAFMGFLWQGERKRKKRRKNAIPSQYVFVNNGALLLCITFPIGKKAVEIVEE